MGRLTGSSIVSTVNGLHRIVSIISFLHNIILKYPIISNQSLYSNISSFSPIYPLISGNHLAFGRVRVSAPCASGLGAVVLHGNVVAHGASLATQPLVLVFGGNFTVSAD